MSVVHSGMLVVVALVVLVLADVEPVVVSESLCVVDALDVVKTEPPLAVFVVTPPPPCAAVPPVFPCEKAAPSSKQEGKSHALATSESVPIQREHNIV